LNTQTLIHGNRYWSKKKFVMLDQHLDLTICVYESFTSRWKTVSPNKYLQNYKRMCAHVGSSLQHKEKLPDGRKSVFFSIWDS